MTKTWESVNPEDERQQDAEERDELLSRIHALKRELAEARAALRECASRSVFTYFVPRYAKEWQERHAAALKAAQEDKP